MAEYGEEDDPVVRELDVYVCNDLIGAQLCLLSHPLRPPWRPYDYHLAKNMRFKQQAKRIEVDIPLDTESVNYNNEEESADHKRIKEITLRSNLTEARTALAMGHIQDGKLLLAPLDYVVQLRPNLAYLNVTKKGKDGEEGEGDDDDKDSTMKAVEVTVHKRETERQQQQRLNSYAYLSQKEQEEQWRTLNLHHPDSVPAEKVWSRIMSPAMDKPPIPYLDRTTYLHAFAPTSAALQPDGEGGMGCVEQPGPQPGTAEAISDEARAAFPEAIKLLFAKHSVCTMANVRQWLLDGKAGDAWAAAKEAATLTDRALHESVLNSGVPIVCIRRMYVLKATGKPDLDPFRKVVLDVLQDMEVFKRADAMEAAKVHNLTVTDPLFVKVVKDICQSRGQSWMLKNGADM